MSPLGNLPWGKIPTSLPFNRSVWEASPRARCIIFGAFCIAGSLGGLDTGMGMDDLAWILREDDLCFVKEALATGALRITPNNTVALTEWQTEWQGPEATAKPVMSDAERQQRRRTRAAAIGHAATNVTPVTESVTRAVTNVTPVTESVTRAVTNVTPTEYRHRQEIQKTTTPPNPPVVVCGGGVLVSSGKMVVPDQPTALALSVTADPRQPMSVEDLIYPARILGGERKAIAVALDSLTPTAAQEVLDELAGTLDAGVLVKNKAGWIRAVAAKAAAGNFYPERGPAVAAYRQQRATTRIQEERLPPAETPEEVERSVRATQARIEATGKDPELVAILLKMGERVIQNSING